VVEYLIPGLRIVEHRMAVPLDWSNPDNGRTIELFAREVSDPTASDGERPVLVFLQGGPGGASPRPMAGEGWIAEAIKTHRVLLVDQRGTGRSSRVESRFIAGLGGTEGAAFLRCFLSDSIVADLEALRHRVFAGVRWQLLGQSYGGFIALSYLSRAPEGLSACYIAGGLAGIHADADEVYRRMYPRVARKTAAFYERYPQDTEAIARVADRVADSEVLLADGDRLTVRRLQLLGLDFGMAAGFERMHWLFDEAWEGDALSGGFLAEIAAHTGYARNPLYMVLQEAIYGSGRGATRWAAERIRAEHPQFDQISRPLPFTGEVTYPWMFEEIRSLRPFHAAAGALAEHEDYPVLYDEDRLAANEVPVVAVAYFDDMYVDIDLSLQTAEMLGNCNVWVTNEYQHDGLRRDSRIIRRLIDRVAESGGGL
jgi:proline iminopeptidase